MTHPHFLAQAAPSAEEHHVVSNGEVTGQSCAAPDYSGIDSIQTLVAKKRIVPPVFLHIVWKEGGCVSTCSSITCVVVQEEVGHSRVRLSVLRVTAVPKTVVVLLEKTLRIALMLDQFCLQSENPFSFSSVSLSHEHIKSSCSHPWKQHSYSNSMIIIIISLFLNELYTTGVRVHLAARCRNCALHVHQKKKKKKA